MLSVLLLVSLCPGLQAQDFYHGGVSARTTALAGIYIPDQSDVVDALSANPAGLSGLAGPSANISLLGGLARGSFFNATNTDSRMRSRPGFVPMGAVGFPLEHGRWSLGAGLLPDFLSFVNWHYADAPGAAGADYGLQAEKSEILAYRAAAGGAYAMTPRLSVGASLGLIYNENILRAPFIFQSDPQLAGLKTLLNLHTHGLAAGGSFGVVTAPSTKLLFTTAYSSPYVVTSHGSASGNMGVQFHAAGIAFAPEFSYNAKVKVKLPQSVTAGGRWQATERSGFELQGDFINFRNAFDRLPVSLSHGTNQDINNFLNSDSIVDQVPLRWSDQFDLRTAADCKIGQHALLEGGYTRRSSLVPNGTATPLTGALMKNAVSVGLEQNYRGLQLAAAYAFNFNQSATIGKSGLLAGEYSNSRLTVGTQGVVVTMTYSRRTDSHPRQQVFTRIARPQ